MSIIAFLYLSQRPGDIELLAMGRGLVSAGEAMLALRQVCL